MDPEKTQQQRRAEVATELGRIVRRQARRKWSAVRTAERNERGHHVWRFRSGLGEGDRFLRISHEAMAQTSNPARLLVRQLRSGRWLDRLDQGPETALLLSTGGRLEPWSAP